MDLQESFPIKARDVDQIKESLSNSDGIINGINAALWLPSWLSLILLLVSLLLMKKGSCCWWTAYTIGCLWFIFILLPLWGILTIPGVLLEDVCDLLPPPNGSSQVFLSTFQGDPDATGVIDMDLVGKLFDECLLPRQGYVWGIVDVNKTFIKDQLAAFDTGAQIDTSSMKDSLAVSVYAKPFLANVGLFETFTGVPNSNYCSSGYAGCQAEVDA